MPTIHDVAEVAGVSVATVSRVMNNRGSISNKMRARVKEAMESLEYQPNEMARSLHLKRTNIIGLVVLQVDQPFYGMLIQSIENICSQYDYKLLLFTSSGDIKKEAMISSMLRANKVDGVLVAGWVKDSSAFAEQNMPVVTIERTINATVPMVTCDNFWGGQLAAKTLIENGCRHPLLFGLEDDINTPVGARLTGFRQECDRLGFPCKSIPTTDYSGYTEHYKTIFAQYPETDGIFTIDSGAVRAKFACMELGIPVPEQVQIIGYDGLDIAETFNITTIAQPIEDMCIFAVELLIKRIKGKTVPTQSILPVRLIPRGTTRGGNGWLR